MALFDLSLTVAVFMLIGQIIQIILSIKQQGNWRQSRESRFEVKIRITVDISVESKQDEPRLKRQKPR